jgi:hypothetical protein
MWPRGFEKQNESQGVLAIVAAGALPQTLSFNMKASPGANLVLFTVQENGSTGHTWQRHISTSRSCVRLWDR